MGVHISVYFEAGNFCKDGMLGFRTLGISFKDIEQCDLLRRVFEKIVDFFGIPFSTHIFSSTLGTYIIENEIARLGSTIIYNVSDTAFPSSFVGLQQRTCRECFVHPPRNWM